MVRFLAIIGVICAIFAGLLFIAGGRAITIKEVSSNIKSGALLVDVRTAAEYQSEHAAGAVNIPVEDMQDGKYPDISKDKTLYVYCHSGKRASLAKSILEKAGYTKVVSLTSLHSWVVLGGKTEGSDLKCSINDAASC